MTIETLTLIVFFITVIFGYWRSGQRFFTLKWFAAIYLPILIIIILRFVSGVGFQLYTLPYIVGAYVLGQWTGRIYGRAIRDRRKINRYTNY